MKPIRIINTKPFEPGSLRWRSMVEVRLYECVDCHKQFEDTGGTALRCKDCRVVYRRAWQKNYMKKWRDAKNKTR